MSANRGKKRTADDYPTGDDLAIPAVGKTPPPRDHVTPPTAAKILDEFHRNDFPFGPGPTRGTIGDYLKLAAEHAGKCDTAIECAIDVAQQNPSLSILIPVLAQLKLDAGKLGRALDDRRRI